MATRTVSSTIGSMLNSVGAIADGASKIIDVTMSVLDVAQDASNVWRTNSAKRAQADMALSEERAFLYFAKSFHDMEADVSQRLVDPIYKSSHEKAKLRWQELNGIVAKAAANEAAGIEPAATAA